MIRPPPSSPLFPSTTLSRSRIVPIYESAASARLTSRWFRRTIHGALQNLAPEIPDGLPLSLCRRLELLDRRTAFQLAHFPDRKSTRLNSSHGYISYAVFCLK